MVEEGTARRVPGSSLPTIKVRPPPPPKLESLHIMAPLSLGLRGESVPFEAFCQGTMPQMHPRSGKAQNRCATYKGREPHAGATVRLKPLCGHWNLRQMVSAKVSEA